uniref:WWE domain-containing protein n=1 Tax=Noctiluca scintillans TaxID=2966 RepID=A0A7S0ZY57_NOCSC|mmetsp:Transcript_23521/g.61883  ORF Transcript_23521/g.61883 Transcript_23521/m.61883 type:complete len:300 (+) Transcript_23521:135-1034(+)
MVSTPSTDAPYWEWKSQLEASDEDAAAWTRFSPADVAKLERARGEGKAEVAINAKYKVNLTDLFQFVTADPFRQRAVRRRAPKRGSTGDGEPDEPPKKKQKALGSEAGGRDFTPKDPRKTDLVAEAKRRNEMPRPTQSELVFFWWGTCLPKTTPKHAVVKPAGAVTVNSNFTSVVACCQRTDLDEYELEVCSSNWEVGFVEPDDFGAWSGFPWLNWTGVAPGRTDITLCNSGSKGGKALKIPFDPGAPIAFNLKIEPMKLTVTTHGKKATKVFPLGSAVKETAVLAFWFYQNKDFAKIN